VLNAVLASRLGAVYGKCNNSLVPFLKDVNHTHVVERR
jgi:hypothetical protein